MAGNQTTLYVYPECPHAFVGFPTQMAKLANLRVNDWINGLLKLYYYFIIILLHLMLMELKRISGRENVKLRVHLPIYIHVRSTVGYILLFD